MSNDPAKLTPKEAFDAIQVLWPKAFGISVHDSFEDNVICVHQSGTILQRVISIGCGVDWAETDGAYTALEALENE